MTSKAARRRQHKESRKLSKVAPRERATTGEAVTVEPPKPIRRILGLDWLKNKGRITEEQYQVGKRLGEVCAEKLRAEMPAKSDTGGAGFGPVTPSQQALAAVAEYGKAKLAITGPFRHHQDGEDMWTLMVAVCHEGHTVRDLANGDRHAALALEERLKVGLAFLRYLVRPERKEAA